MDCIGSEINSELMTLPLPEDKFETWDIFRLVNYIQKMDNNKTLDMKLLSNKTVTLLTTSTAARTSEIHALKIPHIEQHKNIIEFEMN
ncbi:unnamed protein product [Didymodactylos carnosus]|uniref:Uncharacterized protein n=1 Tax=Didymodactylos carnosus TaxID=1234261 RepID=A0A814RP39_9BILA|nr:unnamed protein product [Didymodactylos carnosus]CAF3900280.1 unnamed protein product [Didymodactylos carnosus]